MSNNHNNEPILFDSLSQRDKRSLIFHLLYASESNDYQVNIESLVDNLNRGYDLDIPINNDLVKTAASVIDQRETLDNYLRSSPHRGLSRNSS